MSSLVEFVFSPLALSGNRTAGLMRIKVDNVKWEVEEMVESDGLRIVRQ